MEDLTGLGKVAESVANLGDSKLPNKAYDDLLAEPMREGGKGLTDLVKAFRLSSIYHVAIDKLKCTSMPSLTKAVARVLSSPRARYASPSPTVGTCLHLTCPRTSESSNVVRARRVRKDGTPTMQASCPVPAASLATVILRPVLMIALAILWAPALQAAKVNVIPQVAEMKIGAGMFTLDARTVIAASPETREQARHLAEMLAPATGFHLEIQCPGDARQKAIVLRLNPARAEMGDEGYALDVTADRVVIEAFRPAGVFYGIQTLRQLLPPNIGGPRPTPGVAWSIPCVEIRDRPRFAWRGFMLDSCRHFQSVAVVKQVIDLMARYKLNRLHWHLTEDEAWRVEIPGHLQLTAVGAWRPEPNNPRYGGFYAAKDIREVIAYAKERFVMVYPEVEMPGHGTAALAAYPQFTCSGQAFAPGAPGLRYFAATAGRKAFCPSRPETYAFFEDVVSKVAAMFDSPYIHIGADEVPRAQWSACPRCQAFIQQQQLRDIVGLQGYFTRRMAAYVQSLHKTPIYWGVDLDRGIPAGIIVQGWNPGESLMAIRRGFRTINSNCGETYLAYSAGPGDPDAGTLPHLPIDRMYAFEPVPAKATADQARLVLGGEAALWTETIPEDKVTTKMFPRLFAFAEVLWSPRRPRDIGELRSRIAPQLVRFDLMKVAYFVESPAPPAAAKPAPQGPAAGKALPPRQR